MCLTFEGGEKVVPGYNIMGVAKAALDMAMRYLAYDLGPENIRVNAISPGPIQTVSSMMVNNLKNALNMMEERSPLLRNVTLEDIAGAAVYLASDLSRSVTGSVIKVDAGMNIMAPPTVAHPKSRDQT
jgi:enoyl-[acyl-carrier protein] reductase I